MSGKSTLYDALQYVRAMLPTVLAYGVLALWALMVLQLGARAPAGGVTKAITVTRAQTPVVLGWRELNQHMGPRSASAQHLRITRRGDAWIIANASNDRRVDVRTNRVKSRFVQRWALAAGDRISFAGAEVAVVEVDGDHLILRQKKGGRMVEWRGGGLDARGEAVHKICRSRPSRLLSWARWISRGWLSDDKPEFRLFAIGGGVNCSDRWSLKALPPGAVSVVWQGGKFWLAPGTRRHDALLYRVGAKSPRTFGQLTLRVASGGERIERLILGRTVYLLSSSPAKLVLTPVANIDFWTDDKDAGAPLTPQKWIGAGRDIFAWALAANWRLLPGLLFALVVTVMLGRNWRRYAVGDDWQLLHTLSAVVPALVCGWLTLLLAFGVARPDALLPVWMAWLAWFWATLILVWTRRMVGPPGWLWLAALALAGSGVVTLAQLAAGADNSWWLGFGRKHAAVIALFGWLVVLLCAVPHRFWRRLWMGFFNSERIPVMAAGVLVGLMVLQLVLGSEKGIGGIQPVEAVKTVVVLLLAHVGLHFTEIRRREVKAYREAPLRYLAPYFRFLAIFLFAIFFIVVGVRDFSPILILSIVLLAWLWKAGGRQGDQTRMGWYWRMIRPAILVVLALVVGGALWIKSNPQIVPDGFPQKDRILVWAQPATHQHSGSQVLAAIDRAGEGGWTGARAWFGANGEVLKVPAVQDDFILAFFLHHFGAAAGLSLLAMQILFVTVLFVLGARIEREAARGDFREQNAGLVMGYTLFGLGWMQIGHWLIAWGNSLGLVPVMGQPMTWLSAGNSHLMGFAMVTLALALMSAWATQPSAIDSYRH
ncbi:MAG: FtsW/RodA/SpoVE family cell cycle protein [Alphaproteobacteria bacterium]